MVKKKSESKLHKNNGQQNLKDFVSSPYETGGDESHNIKKQSEGRNINK